MSIFGLQNAEISPSYMLTLALYNVLATEVMGSHKLRAAHVKLHVDPIKQWNESCKVQTVLLILSGISGAFNSFTLEEVILFYVKVQFSHI